MKMKEAVLMALLVCVAVAVETSKEEDRQKKDSNEKYHGQFAMFRRNSFDTDEGDGMIDDLRRALNEAPNSAAGVDGDRAAEDLQHVDGGQMRDGCQGIHGLQNQYGAIPFPVLSSLLDNLDEDQDHALNETELSEAVRQLEILVYCVNQADRQ